MIQPVGRIFSRFDHMTGYSHKYKSTVFELLKYYGLPNAISTEANGSLKSHTFCKMVSDRLCAVSERVVALISTALSFLEFRLHQLKAMSIKSVFTYGKFHLICTYAIS